jgi:uncharacterized protein (TIGR02271 family)
MATTFRRRSVPRAAAAPSTVVERRRARRRRHDRPNAPTECTDEEEPHMMSEHDLDRVIGATAYDSDGDRVGSVDTVYVDDETNQGKFALVNTGLFGMSSSFVPLEGASLDGDDLRLAHTKDRIKDAPNLDPDGHLEPEQEQELFRYYGIDEGHGTAGIPTTDSHTAGTPTSETRPESAPTSPGTPETTGHDTTGHDTSGPETDDAMTRSEEELRVGKEQRETGRARLRKHVVTENVTKTVPVQREEVRLEREPVSEGNVDAATDGPELSEEEHEVVLHEEEPVVEKRTVPTERVRLDKEVHTDEEQISEEVAHEEIELVDDDDAAASRRQS